LVAYDNPSRSFAPATAAMTDGAIPLFPFPAVQGKKVTAAFDGGRISSDGGVTLLSMVERRLVSIAGRERCVLSARRSLARPRRLGRGFRVAWRRSSQS